MTPESGGGVKEDGIVLMCVCVKMGGEGWGDGGGGGVDGVEGGGVVRIVESVSFGVTAHAPLNEHIRLSVM